VARKVTTSIEMLAFGIAGDLLAALPRPHESQVVTLEALPELAVFSSDYPHFRRQSRSGWPLDKELASLDPGVRARFMSGNIAASYELLGHPL
jgi:hypothetical protein